MAKKKQKKDDYKGYYPDEVKCGGKGGYGGKSYGDKYGNRNRRNNDKYNGERIQNNNTYFENNSSVHTDSNTDAGHKNTERRNRPQYNNERPNKNFKPRKDFNEKKVERTYAVPTITPVEGEENTWNIPIEFSRSGLSTIKLLTLKEAGLLVIDGHFKGPKTALVINTRDPEKGFKAAVAVNPGDMVVTFTIDGTLSLYDVYQITSVPTKPDEETKLGNATAVSFSPEYESEWETIIHDAVGKVIADPSFVYAREKVKKETNN